MKTTDKPITVTSTAKLTIHGTTHDLTMEELSTLYDKIGEALGKKTQPDLGAIWDKMKRENDRARPRPQPYWPSLPRPTYNEPVRPFRKEDVICLTWP